MESNANISGGILGFNKSHWILHLSKSGSAFKHLHAFALEETTGIFVFYNIKRVISIMSMLLLNSEMLVFLLVVESVLKWRRK